MMRPLWLAVAAAGVGLVCLNFSGFCYSQHRWLSDAELIRIAANRNLHQVDGQTITYSSADDLLTRNPDCCDVSSWSPWLDTSLIVRALGFYNAVVSIAYRIADGGDEPFYQSYVFLSSCGTVRDVWGIQTQIVRYPRRLGASPAVPI